MELYRYGDFYIGFRGGISKVYCPVLIKVPGFFYENID